MRIGDFDAQYVSHVCFILTSPQGAVLVTDPLFAEGFTWKGCTERYLSRPDIAPEDIRCCDAVFVSHIHGDHYDPDAVETIVRNTGARVWAPADVVDDLAERGAPAPNLVALDDGAALSARDLSARAMAGYDDSFDDQGRPNKFSLLLRAGQTTALYSGDCHDPPPALAGHSVDAVFAWAHPNDDKLRNFGAACRPAKYVLMHGDRFEPGDFFCNFDIAAEKARIERLVPGAEVVIPERIRSVG